MPKDDYFENYVLTALYTAYREARRGKRNTMDEHKFELNEADNLVRLCNAILNRTYEPGGGTRHIIEDPVIREIIAAPFPDRVVHHFICDHIVPWWEPRLIYNSYSCRKKKGTDFGILDLQRQMRKVTQNYGRTFVIKLDIQGYFMHISHQKLYDRLLWGLNRQYPEGGDLYKTLKFLIRQTVFDDPRSKVRDKCSPKDISRLVPEKCLMLQPDGRGLVIGNYTSQVFSNIYLDMLDRFVKFDLGYENYGRYVDDFFIIVPEAQLEIALRDVKEIEAFLTGIGLTLHPNKRYVQDVRHGVPFLGAVVYTDHIIAGERACRNLGKSVRDLMCGAGSIESLQSHLGHLMHRDAKLVEQKVFRSVGWEYLF